VSQQHLPASWSSCLSSFRRSIMENLQLHRDPIAEGRGRLILHNSCKRGPDRSETQHGRQVNHESWTACHGKPLCSSASMLSPVRGLRNPGTGAFSTPGLCKMRINELFHRCGSRYVISDQVQCQIHSCDQMLRNERGDASEAFGSRSLDSKTRAELPEQKPPSDRDPYWIAYLDRKYGTRIALGDCGQVRPAGH